MSHPEPALTLYVIYANPRDYPGQFVVRAQRIRSNEIAVMKEPLAVTLTLEEARAAVPPGLYRMDRYEGDDAVIVETWL